MGQHALKKAPVTLEAQQAISGISGGQVAETGLVTHIDGVFVSEVVVTVDGDRLGLAEDDSLGVEQAQS